MGAEENKDEFTNNLRWFREHHGLSLEELAERSGVSLDILKQLEQNILPQEMMASDACNLALTFHCKISELLQ